MPRENIYTEDPTIKKKNAQSKQGVPASLHQDMEPAPTLPPRAFEQIKDSTMGGSKPPVPSPRSTPNMDRPPVLPPRAER
ncbi:hypothetical protein IGJ22_001304 [Enterococcus sp. DIV0448]|uniref:hypothetical protein n=1 Tax=unclassified Enterococcus TaxID=2608891 RepID=UPI0019DCEFAE|nr:hypothetical protein [Enterococcus hirae]EMF0406293.1 hypothetical protein [Enterococcus hirae]EMF0512274.1 hypothetical protein [Enterococcus hirae]